MLKCEFCSDSLGKELFPGPRDIGLCEACFTTFNSNKIHNVEEEMENNVIDIKEAQDVEFEEVEKAESPIKCEIVIAIREDSSLVFKAGGSDVNLLTIDGLLKFAERKMSAFWTEKEAIR